MALTDHNITPLTLPLYTSKRLIAHTCQSIWNEFLTPVLQTTSVGQYRSDSSPQPWVRKISCKLDVVLTHLHLGQTRLTTHLQRMSLAPDPYCPWCISIPETMNHFMLECPRFHLHRVVLQEELRALGVTTFDLPTLLGATGIDSSWQSAVLCLICAFLNKTNQLQRL
ncbi:hypothetical protein E2C01_076159 [Portunus trituberculatus]|uniref:Reverse transcriptase zinc-binding domain-containing protein n=1 Tax=Portunus trituberculatus TaxID=210409 RepID=A0A5B7IJ35_PORTR|nr:hypothetical protein [Portunus trituberculatus]